MAEASLSYTGLLAAGSHTIQAVYLGNSSLDASCSSVSIVNVSPGVVDGPQVADVQRYGYHALPTSFVVTFNEPLNPASAQDTANYRIVGLNGAVEPIASAVYNAATMTVTLYPTKQLNLHLIYHLTIIGTGASGVADVSGNLLDGARTGQPGSNYVGTLTASQLVVGATVPGGPAQQAKVRKELSQIVANQTKQLAKKTPRAKDAGRPEGQGRGRSQGRPRRLENPGQDRHQGPSQGRQHEPPGCEEKAKVIEGLFGSGGGIGPSSFQTDIHCRRPVRRDNLGYLGK